MSTVINTNLTTLTAQRSLAKSAFDMSSALQRLSSGVRINSARDDASGLAISDRMTVQIRGYNQGIRNASDGVSLVQTAEGGLDALTNSLQRMRELAVQSMSDTNTQADRIALDQEVQQLKAEVMRIAENTTFNGQNILNGSLSSLNLQIGAESSQTLAISGVDARASQLSGSTVLTVSPTSNIIDTFTGQLYTTLTDISINGGSPIDLQDTITPWDVADAINNAYPDGTVQARVKPTVISLGTLNSGPGQLNYNFRIWNISLVNLDPANVSSLIFDTAGKTAAQLRDEINNAPANSRGDIVASLDENGDLVISSASGAEINLQEPFANLFEGISYASLSNTFSGGVEITSGLETLTIGGTNAATLGLTGTAVNTTATLETVSVASRSGAVNALGTIDGAIDMVSSMRAELGAIQNRLENAIDVSRVQNENLSAARSRIRDADFAVETAKLTKAQIFQQAGLASLAQANVSPQTVLSLLR
jgi:flagellin